MLLTKVVLASCWLLFTDVSPTTLFTSFCRVAVGSIREFKINDATKFAYLIDKNKSFARPSRAFFNSVHFFQVLDKSAT